MLKVVRLIAVPRRPWLSQNVITEAWQGKRKGMDVFSDTCFLTMYNGTAQEEDTRLAESEEGIRYDGC
jgi:hypothetical protein